MKQALLMFLSVDHLHVQRMEDGKIAAQADYDNTAEGRKHFGDFIRGLQCPSYLLTDLIEEDFRHEIVPHLIGGSRTALLKRKFEQFYRNTPFHQATLLQRQTSGRRDDDMLFSALTNPGLILPWVEILLAHKIPLAGIYSVPQISAPLVKHLPSKHLLLISWEKFSGLRQTYFSNHHLQISRLTLVHSGLTFHDAVVQELLRTYQYLKSLSLLPTGETLNVYILCDAIDRNELFNRLTISVDMRYDFADINVVGEQLKVGQRSNDSDATQIFLHQLLQSPPATHYANASYTYYYSLWKLKHALNFAAAALFATALVWSVVNIWQSRSAVDEGKALQVQAQRTLSDAQQITRAFPNTYAQAGDMKAGVTLMRKLAGYGAPPDDVLLPISFVLNHYPKMRVDELAWQTSPTEPVAPNTVGDMPARVVSLKGHLVEFANDYRAALNYLDQFQNELAGQGYRVTVLSKPFDVSPGGSIVGQNVGDTNHPLDYAYKISSRPAL